jgi:hypothetical protein
MKILLRTLSLAFVLAALVSTPRAVQAFCLEGGICSQSCDPCFGPSDCPPVDGVRQFCLCGYQCP